MRSNESLEENEDIFILCRVKWNFRVIFQQIYLTICIHKLKPVHIQPFNLSS